MISAEKGTRSMASALPAGTAWRSAVAMTRPRGRAHLPVEEADGVLLVVVGAEGVGADELGQRAGLVGGRPDRGAHLVQDDRHARLGGLPGGLGAGEAAADDVDGFAHGGDLGHGPGNGKGAGCRYVLTFDISRTSLPGMRHEHAPGGGSHHHHPENHAHHRRRRRPFDYGELRLLVLGMIREEPRHGYELMKGIEERMGGGYSPSPGVIYPTLAWLEDMGHAAADSEGSRRRYRVTAEGEAFLAANQAALAELRARLGAPGGRRHSPEPILDGMDRLKRALRARFLRGPVDAAQAAAIATAIEGRR